MKELTIEEKAKAYDNIIEKANKMHHENCEACQMCIEELIPELVENEDERIGKEIVNFINHRKAMGSVTPEESKRTGSWIAWLEEKQQIEIDNIVLSPVEYQETIERYFKDGMNEQKKQIKENIQSWLDGV